LKTRKTPRAALRRPRGAPPASHTRKILQRAAPSRPGAARTAAKHPRGPPRPAAEGARPPCGTLRAPPLRAPASRQSRPPSPPCTASRRGSPRPRGPRATSAVARSERGGGEFAMSGPPPSPGAPAGPRAPVPPKAGALGPCNHCVTHNECLKRREGVGEAPGGLGRHHLALPQDTLLVLDVMLVCGGMGRSSRRVVSSSIT